jgi:hypothetical protein
MRFGPLQHSLAAALRCPADATPSGRDPASAFPPPARALSLTDTDGVRPCGFALEAA